MGNILYSGAEGRKIGYAQAPVFGSMLEWFGWWVCASGPTDLLLSYGLLGRIGLGMRWWKSSR